MRVKKTTSAGAVLYGWDKDRIFAEYDQNANAIQETVYFGSTPVALLKDGQTYRIFADQIDTPRVITDNTNTALWAWDSKPFGETQPDEDVNKDGTSLSYNLRFPGQYYDQETGKHYNFNRDYDPVTGRYIQSDPIGLDGGMNLYGYVEGKPLNSMDTNGKLPTFTFGRYIDISLDVHSDSDIDKAIILIKKYRRIRFTVFLYAAQRMRIPDLKRVGVQVGLHIGPSASVSDIDVFYNYVKIYQPTNKTPTAIHGSGYNNLTKVQLDALMRYGVPYVRASRHFGYLFTHPKMYLVLAQQWDATRIRKRKDLNHYFTHVNQILRLPDFNRTIN